MRSVFEAPASPLNFPRRGRPGRKDGTRELVLSPLPYVVVYAVRGDVIYIVRILHGAQQWLEKDLIGPHQVWPADSATLTASQSCKIGVL